MVILYFPVHLRWTFCSVVIMQNCASVHMEHWTHGILNSGINVAQLSISALFSERNCIGVTVIVLIWGLPFMTSNIGLDPLFSFSNIGTSLCGYYCIKVYLCLLYWFCAGIDDLHRKNYQMVFQHAECYLAMRIISCSVQEVMCACCDTLVNEHG